MTPQDALAAALHHRHFGCRTDYRGDWDCDGPLRHEPDAELLLAASGWEVRPVGLDVERLDAAICHHEHDRGAPLDIRSDHLVRLTFRTCAAAIAAAYAGEDRE